MNGCKKKFQYEDNLWVVVMGYSKKIAKNNEKSQISIANKSILKAKMSRFVACNC